MNQNDSGQQQNFGDVNIQGSGNIFHNSQSFFSLTVYDPIPQQLSQPTTSVVKPLTQQEHRQRKVLLNKVKEYWVEGVLEASLHTKALIELGLEERTDAVKRPFSGVEEFPKAATQALPEGTSATTLFNQMSEGRTLLILGEPGSGKTITLLKLAEDLIARSKQDLSQPIPVVFNLSSWAKRSQGIEQWLIQELLEKYQVSKELGKQLVETESLILLLDGLDEVKADRRNACVQAINQFMQTQSTTELTICCRIRDYQALAEQLMLRSAIGIQPLTFEQIDRYFEQAGEQLKSLRTILRQDVELQGLATSPLMLSIMSLAYQNSSPNDIIQGGTVEDYRKGLFDTYIDRMFQRRGTTQQYSRQETRHWLIWLAQRLTDTAQTVFLIERLQPRWLPNRRRRFRFRLESSLIGVVFSGLFGGLAVGLVAGLAWGLTGGLAGELFAGTAWGELGSLIGYILLGGLVGGLVGLAFALMASFFEDIQPVETLRWSWKATRQLIKLSLLYGGLIGLMVMLIWWLIYGQWERLMSTLTGGLVMGLIVGLLAALIGGFRGSEIQQKGKPNQGIHRSAQSAIILGLSFGLSIGLSAWLIYRQIDGQGNDGLSELAADLMIGLFFGIIIGLMAALIGGGSACIRHIALRRMLYRSGYSPPNYARFLDYAAERLFLQKVGGGYIFVHRMLLEHFAAMPLEQRSR